MGWASRAETHRLELRLNGGNVSRLGGGGVERTGVARGKAEQVQGGLRRGETGYEEMEPSANNAHGRRGRNAARGSHRRRVRDVAQGGDAPRGGQPLRRRARWRRRCAAGGGRRGRTMGQRCGVFSWNAMGTRLGGNTGRWARRRSAVARVVERIHAPSTRRRHPRRSAAAWPPARTGPRGRWRWCEASSRASVSASSDAEEPPEARERAENRAVIFPRETLSDKSSERPVTEKKPRVTLFTRARSLKNFAKDVFANGRCTGASTGVFRQLGGVLEHPPPPRRP